MTRPELFQRAQLYCVQRGMAIVEQLGFGVHGNVFAVENQIRGGSSAIKVHERQQAYCRERDVYLHLERSGLKEVHGCAVPEMLAYDDQLWVIEMTIVTRPFVLDFAGAYLGWPPDFSDDVLADWRAEKQEQFGPRWPEVQAILRELEAYGVFMVDVNPGNVAFCE